VAPSHLIASAFMALDMMTGFQVTDAAADIEYIGSGRGVARLGTGYA